MDSRIAQEVGKRRTYLAALELALEEAFENAL
jgi:hypothetical protein